VSAFTDTGVPEDEGQHLQSVIPTAGQAGGIGRFGYSPSGHLTEGSALATAASRERLLGQWARHWDLSKPRLLEKSPPNLVRARFLQALFPNSYFVMVIRHPVAVITALERWHGAPKPLKAYRLLRHWAYCYETMLRDARNVEKLRLVRYEDMVAAPEPQIESIHRFIGLVPELGSRSAKSGLNERYFDVWARRRRRPVQGWYLDAVSRGLEHRVRVFGYSLADPDAAPAPHPLVAQLMRAKTYEH